MIVQSFVSQSGLRVLFADPSREAYAAIPGLIALMGGITTWLEFLAQWDPTSPWHDRRVRLAANLAID